jgi:general stress protein 26
MNTHQAAEFARLIDGISVVMMTTHNAEGALRSRPLLLERVDDDGTLVFLTHRSSQKVHELDRDDRVNIAFVGTAGDRYVSATGRARISGDQTDIAALWNPTYRAWFPKGPHDPDLAILRVAVSCVEYWDVPSSRLVRLWDMARAMASGTPADTGDRMTLTCDAPQQKIGPH